MKIVWDPFSRTLRNIAVFGGLTTTVFGVFVYHSLRKRYAKLDAYKAAVDKVTANRHVKMYLGEPIKVRGVELGDNYNHVNDKIIKLAVKLVGPKSSGMIYLDADPSLPVESSLTSVEFELDKPKGRIKLL